MNIKTVLYDPMKYVEFEDNPDLVTTKYNEYKHQNLFALIEQYAETEEKTQDEETAITLKVLNWLIAKKLGLVPKENIEYLIEQILDADYVDEKIKNLETIFKNHRHAQDKTYGEKPIW